MGVSLVLALQQPLTLFLGASNLQVQLPFQLQNCAFLGLQLCQLQHTNKPFLTPITQLCASGVTEGGT
jgi:hypothetical protein